MSPAPLSPAKSPFDGRNQIAEIEMMPFSSFGLDEDPFKITPDQRFIFLHTTIKATFTDLLSKIADREGLMLLVGGSGTGKTVLLQILKQRLEEGNCLTFHFPYPKVSFDDLLGSLCREAGLPGGDDTRSGHIELLAATLKERLANGGTAVVLMDEAQNLSDDVLLHLHLLTDLGIGERRLLQFVLAGLPQLETMLGRIEVLQRPNPPACLRLERLDPQEIGLYIAHRMQVAGFQGGTVFTAEAIAQVAQYSCGIPGLINRLCGTALLIADGQAQRVVLAETINQAADTCALRPPTSRDGVAGPNSLAWPGFGAADDRTVVPGDRAGDPGAEADSNLDHAPVGEVTALAMAEAADYSAYATTTMLPIGGSLNAASQPGPTLAPSRPGSPANGFSLSALDLEEARRDLTLMLGPIAQVLVRNAARQAASLTEVYRLLAEHIPDEQQRRAFLAERTPVTAMPAIATPSRPGPPAGRFGLSALDLKRARRNLTNLTLVLDPIAQVLAGKVAQWVTSLTEVYRRSQSAVPMSISGRPFGVADSGRIIQAWTRGGVGPVQRRYFLRTAVLAGLAVALPAPVPAAGHGAQPSLRPRGSGLRAESPARRPLVPGHLQPEPEFPLRSNPPRPNLQSDLRSGQVALQAPLGGPRRLAGVSRRHIALYNVHTGERIDLDYARDGRYRREALVKLNHFLRDWRTGTVIDIDPGTIDILCALRLATGTREPFYVLSGYRTRRTNELLRRLGRDVARNSLHMQGKAIDICLPGYNLRGLRDHALALRSGGVGYYPDHGFIHVDTGTIRTWG